MSKVIDQIIAKTDLERPVSPPALMPKPLTLQRANRSSLNVYMPQFRCCVHSSNYDKPENTELESCPQYSRFNDNY